MRNNVVKNKIVYSGLSEYIPSNIDSFSQMNLSNIIRIDDKLPNAGDILKVSVKPNIKDNKLVKTAIGTSLEGQHLTGCKLLTEGEFAVRVDYCSLDNDGSIYTYRDNLYFKNSTTLDSEINQNTRMINNIYTEDIYAQILEEREILINISFTFTAENY